MTTRYHLAQINIARMRAPLDDPLLAGFVARLAEINALADTSPGFVWRLQTPGGDATALRPYEDDRILINMSVWETPEHFRDYVYRSAHAEVMRQRKLWFERFDGAYTAMWWVATGHIPTLTEAVERLDHLRANGDTAFAFTLKQLHPPPGEAKQTPSLGFPDACPAM